MTWTEHAACRDADGDIFFPIGGQDYREARDYCSRCPVRDECLDVQMRWEAVHANHSGMRAGMYGGLTPDERLSRRRRRAAA